MNDPSGLQAHEPRTGCIGGDCVIGQNNTPKRPRCAVQWAVPLHRQDRVCDHKMNRHRGADVENAFSPWAWTQENRFAPPSSAARAASFRCSWPGDSPGPTRRGSDLRIGFDCPEESARNRSRRARAVCRADAPVLPPRLPVWLPSRRKHSAAAATRIGSVLMALPAM
jgi:hypothetical protein